MLHQEVYLLQKEGIDLKSKQLQCAKPERIGGVAR